VDAERDRRHWFATTRWTVVLAAGAQRSADSDAALALLCEAYWYPLYAFLRARGHDADEAQDLTQAFFLQVIEKRPFTHADPSRGRFRSFLLTSLKNFAANEYNRQNTLKRGGRASTLSLDLETAEGRLRLEPVSGETPEHLFERKWTLTLLERALDRVRDEVMPERPQQFDLLKGYLTGNEDQPTYAETAAALGMSEGAVKVAVHRLRRRFRELVRDEIAETVSSPAEIEEEIRYLWASVSADRSRAPAGT
jgi:RNA polymerase sigma-70 factor (ECF subfamily)